MAERKRLEISPEDAYDLAVAALALVGGVSAGVHKRIRQPGNNSNPTVIAQHLAELTDVLNRVSGGAADRMIAACATKPAQPEHTAEV